jgi:nucleoside-triphosphatase
VKTLKRRVLLLTGAPGIGKTTILARTAELLKSEGYSVGGMISREVRVKQNRVGFEIIDVTSSSRNWLAHVDQKIGPQVGRYRVNISGLEATGVPAVLNAVQKADVVFIDEVGPMELFSSRFKDAVRKAVESEKPVIAIVHWKAADPFIGTLKVRGDSEMFVASITNRDELPETLSKKVIEYVKYIAA